MEESLQKIVDAVFTIIRFAQPDEFDPDEIINISRKDFNKLSNAFTKYTHEELTRISRESNQMDLLFL